MNSSSECHEFLYRPNVRRYLDRRTRREWSTASSSYIRKSKAKKSKAQAPKVIPYCPNCGTERDASFIESDGKCIAVHCLPCGTSLPCYPECGITGIRRTENQLALECPSCEVTIPDPKIEDDDWGITSKEMQFLLNVGARLSSDIGKLRSFEHYKEKLKIQIS